MSKQYFATSLTPEAHPADIFSVETTPEYAITSSGNSILKLWNAVSNDHELVLTIKTTHKLGIHHVCANKESGLVAAVGFDGEISVWSLQDGSCRGVISDPKTAHWAARFSADGEFLAATSLNGEINVWNTAAGEFEKCGELETKGSSGLAIDYSSDGRFIASGHENGGLYIFSTETARMLHSLPGHIKAVRAVAFSPVSKLLAAGGDSNIITVYDVTSGEQVFNLSGHSRWIMSLDWNFTGEYILSGSFDKSLKVWSIEQTECVATQTEADSAVWAVKWTKTAGTARPQGFVSVGIDKTIRWYREATGG
ncbi:WD40-repeat-containing domain protein [Lipomyces tetrasporus]|uniref:WD40-repeat-containing domain protein n=1 Tax=Lipomyces tetrasporus TaxID=54092 RepID=A0AAD7VVH6_9ASCO|nr:WD40-repeat-containing domain protein [Lipomyces tetrasporus]KAJ8103001.1 WD40-repeat-containing domain protein [Lipomyces tetrasporus]